MNGNGCRDGMVLNAKYTDNQKIIGVSQVEPAGVEPASKHAARLLSTSLVFVWLSATAWYETDLAAAYLLKFRACCGASICYLSFYDTSDRTLDGRTSGEAPAATDLVWAAGSAAVRLRMHKKFRRLLASRVEC